MEAKSWHQYCYFSLFISIRNIRLILIFKIGFTTAVLSAVGYVGTFINSQFSKHTQPKTQNHLLINYLTNNY